MMKYSKDPEIKTGIFAKIPAVFYLRSHSFFNRSQEKPKIRHSFLFKVFSVISWFFSGFLLYFLLFSTLDFRSCALTDL